LDPSISLLVLDIKVLTKSRTVFLAILILCSFHPYAFILFDHSLAEVLLVVLTVLSLAGFLDLWNKRDDEDFTGWKQWGLAILTSFSFSMAYHTRKEGVLLLAPLGLTAIYSLFHRQPWWGRT
jgi:predicted membrane channel-forming protein YqfA (hemolysin III family)